jgi:hypothetical protein
MRDAGLVSCTYTQLDRIMFVERIALLGLAKQREPEIDVREIFDQLTVAASWMASAQTLKQARLDLNRRRYGWRNHRLSVPLALRRSGSLDSRSLASSQ